MPDQAEIEIPDEGAVVRLEETAATEDALAHGPEFEVVETRWRKAPSLSGGYATTYTTVLTPKGEDRPRLRVPTEAILTD